MTDVGERPFMRAQLSDFSLMVLHRAVVLLLLTHSGGGQSQVTGSPQPIVAMIGDDIILPCHLESSVNPLDLTVEWIRRDLEPKFVHLRRNRGDLLYEQHQSYTGRTSLSTNRLKYGDLSLKLSSVTLSDAGRYHCFIRGSTAGSVVELAEVELVVGSVSSPNIAISKVGNGVLLDCESKGWYPEPEASWLDSKGNLLSTGPSEAVTGPDDLYTVSSRVTVEKRHSNSFTCRVQQKTINQSREAQIHVPDDFFKTQSSTAVRITISLAACFLCGLTVALVVCKIKKTKMHQDKIQPDERKTIENLELQHLMAKHEAREHFMTSSEMKQLDTAEETFDEKLKRSVEEMKHVEKVISLLEEQKNNLEKQQKTINSLKQRAKAERKKLKGKDKYKTIKKELQEEYDKVFKTTESFLVEKIILTMTERKGKLEGEQEQIEIEKKKTEKQREVREKEREETEVREKEREKETEKQREVREKEREKEREETEKQREKQREEVQRNLESEKQEETDDPPSEALI